jgi:tetratricopeptide (TPR) repeat protein
MPDWMTFLGDVASDCMLSPDQRRAFLARFDRLNAGKTEKWIADHIKDERGDLVFSGDAAFKKLMTAAYRAVQRELFPELAKVAKGKREKLEAFLQERYRQQFPQFPSFGEPNPEEVQHFPELRDLGSEGSSRSTNPQTNDIPDSNAPIADKSSVPSISECPLIKNSQKASDNSQATQINDAKAPVIVGSNPTVHINLPKQQDEPSEKIILMLPASSSSIHSPRWIGEFKRIESSIKNAFSRHKEVTDRNQKFDKYKFESKQYITFSELSQELTTLEPRILHITGEVDGIGELLIGDMSRNTEDYDELIFNLFKLNSQFISCVILSGCCIEDQVNGIIQYIEFIISVPRELEESLVIAFFDEFYFHLCFVRDVKTSYELGIDKLKKLIGQRPDFERNLFPRIFSKEEEEKRKKEEVRRRDLERDLEICIRDLEMHGNDLVLWKKKASLLQDLGRINEMNEAYEKVALLDPDNYQNRIKQGNALVALEEYKKADSAYDKAVEAEDGEKDYKVWWQKAIAYAKAGEYIKAGDAYQKALWLLPPSPDDYVICTQYGVVLNKLKQFRESIQLYSTSLCLQPNYRVASYRRKQLYKKIYSENG